MLRASDPEATPKVASEVQNDHLDRCCGGREHVIKSWAGRNTLLRFNPEPLLVI